MTLMTLNSWYQSQGLRKQWGHDTVLSAARRGNPLLEHLGPIFSYRIGQQVEHFIRLSHGFCILIGQVWKQFLLPQQTPLWTQSKGWGISWTLWANWRMKKQLRKSATLPEIIWHLPSLHSPAIKAAAPIEAKELSPACTIASLLERRALHWEPSQTPWGTETQDNGVPMHPLLAFIAC